MILATTIRDMLREAAAALAGAGIPVPRLDAEVLLAHCLGRERLFLFTNPEAAVPEGNVGPYRRLIARRLTGEPVAYIVGRKEFWSLPLDVDRRVLIPRPETEILVEEALKVVAASGNLRPEILDVGVGSGAISLALARELKDARICAVDISPEAIALARENAAKLGLLERISFIVGDMFEAISGPVDMIVSNPPYIADEAYESLPDGVRNFEPSLALKGGPDGLHYYGVLIGEGGERLRPGGWLLLEIGADQAAPLRAMLKRSSRYEEIRFRADYGGIERVVMARRR